MSRQVTTSDYMDLPLLPLPPHTSPPPHLRGRFHCSCCHSHLRRCLPEIRAHSGQGKKPFPLELAAATTSPSGDPYTPWPTGRGTAATGLSPLSLSPWRRTSVGMKTQNPPPPPIESPSPTSPDNATSKEEKGECMEKWFREMNKNLTIKRLFPLFKRRLNIIEYLVENVPEYYIMIKLLVTVS